MSIPFTGFSNDDFDVFLIPGLEPRMNALISNVRPKLEQLGTILAPTLSVMCGEEIFPHVAKHARRSVNPPNDTWVAYANSKRGYKALPHFQIGLWSTHVFIQFAVIYESPEHKRKFADELMSRRSELLAGLPEHYFWSLDHTKPDVQFMSDMMDHDYDRVAEKLLKVKKSEVLCGLQLKREDPLLRDGEGFVQLAEQTFRNLLPLYRAAF